MTTSTQEGTHSIGPNDPTTEVPEEFICPLTLSLMQDPVISKYGHSFERESILEYLGRGSDICPCTRQPLRMRDVITNHKLRSKIRRWQIENEEDITVIMTPNTNTRIYGYISMPEKDHEETERTEDDEEFVSDNMRESLEPANRRRGAGSRSLLRGLFRSRPARSPTTSI
jgi:hypothetical protein|uniref:U-box domain-containing protein n=1 Tax=Phaeodactylum tricornutum TaxID=2850 RepID=A0A8J9X3X3_PHATR